MSLRGLLRNSKDTYTRACALVLLQHGGTERDLEAIQSDLERATYQSATASPNDLLWL